MAKRIFISFLGTGRYTPCWYTVNGKKLTEEPVRFVQEAMVRHFCMNESSPWTAEDRILIFCTHYSDINKKDGAKETNWCDNNRFSEYGLEHFLKGMAEQGLDADFVCLQETKLQAGQIDLEFPGYRSYWNYAEKKGYSGTAVYTKHEPLSVRYGSAWRNMTMKAA